MGILARKKFMLLATGILLLHSACSRDTQTYRQSTANAAADRSVSTYEPSEPSEPEEPEYPDLQGEITDDRFRRTISHLGKFDFLNYTYLLPRGWQNPDGSDITLVDGKLEAISGTVDENASDEERSRQRAERRIGMSHVVTKYFDATGDGEDEAIVILKIETGGNAIPQVIYIFTWKDDKPDLIWHFRTGDRADGGLKDIRAENGELVVELYGQDRFLLGQAETGKITGDEQQLCCPTHFTRSFYKWNGKNFQLQRKRLTYETANPSAQPLENHGDIMNDPVKSREYLKRTNKVKDS